ncbi:MAG: SurA N-terminal domain-containing protein [Dehalococcoidia bacterium]
MGRGPFFAMVIGGLVAIVALGAATVFLALDRGGGSDNPVVATVNGEEIRRSEYDRAVAQSNGEQVLDQLILERLITAEAQKRDIAIGDQEATMLLDDLRQEEQLEDDSVFQAALAQAGLTEESLAHQLRLNEMIRRMVADQTQVSDQEVDSEFQANQSAYTGQDEALAKAQIKSDLQQEKESSAAQGLLQQLRAAADVEMKVPGKVQS